MLCAKCGSELNTAVCTRCGYDHTAQEVLYLMQPAEVLRLRPAGPLNGSLNGMEIKDGVLRKYHGREAHVVIPEGVTEIGPFAFAKNGSVQTVAFPSTLQRIGIHAFEDCQSLQELMIPEGVTEIDDQAFHHCIGLESVALPDSLERIGEYAFSLCGMREVTIPVEVREIGRSAFFLCSQLEWVTILGPITELPNAAFQWCFALKQIILPDTVEVIGEEVFLSCEKLEFFTLPPNLRMIKAGAFRSCKGLKELTIPDTLVSVHKDAFLNCNKMEVSASDNWRKYHKRLLKRIPHRRSDASELSDYDENNYTDESDDTDWVYWF